MLERLRLFRDRDKSRDRGTICRDSKSKEKAKVVAVETKRQRASSTDSRAPGETAAAATTATAMEAAASATAPTGGYQLSEQLRERIQRRVQFAPSTNVAASTVTTARTAAETTEVSKSAASTNDRYTELLSKLERRQRLSATSGQQRRYEGSDSGGSGSPYSRLRLLGLGAAVQGRQSDSADEAARNGGSRYRGGYSSGGYASDGYTSECGVYYGVVANLARPLSQLQQQQQQQQQQHQQNPSRCSTSASTLANPHPPSRSQLQLQQQARRRRRCYGSADECDDGPSAAVSAAEAAEAAAAASQCRLRATGASLCLSDAETCGTADGSLLRQRRQISSRQQRCSDSVAGSLSDNESTTASMVSTAQQQRWRALEVVHLPYPGGSCAGRFASLDRSGLGSASLLSPTSAAAATAAAERRAREIRQLRSELAEARQRASSLAAALSVNATAVSAFERRLGGASARLRELATSAQRGDAEIDRLRAAIEQMRSGGGRAGDTGSEIVDLLDMPVGAAANSTSFVLLAVVVDVGGGPSNEAPMPIGRLRVRPSAAWPDIGSGARRLLREFAIRVDPPGGLGLGGDSVAACRLDGGSGAAGESFDIDLVASTATPTTPHQQLLAAAADSVSRFKLRLTLRSSGIAEEVASSAGGRSGGASLDALAFETLVPKAVLQRYVCLLTEHRRLVLCGPAGTGKTYLAQRLARHMARLEGRTDVSSAVAEFNGESRRGEQELRAFLAEAASQSVAEVSAKRSSSRSVQVLLLDNLQHLAPLAEARSGLAASRLYIICTVRRGLRQLQSLDDGGIGGEVGFRWLLCANHLEPVRGLLGRHLRRQRMVADASDHPSHQTAEPSRRHQLDDWLPGAWQRVNAFLEARGGGPDATLGPGPLLGCPLEPAASRDWFVSLWNHALAPRLLAASSMTSTATGSIATTADWEDPADWVLSTWPWPEMPPGDGELVRLRPQANAPDPLMAMLMKLREAAAASGRGEADEV